MNNIIEIVQAICIGLLVALFLLNTCRALKATELFKECLALLDNNEFKIKDTLFLKMIYLTTLNACLCINDYTRAMEYATKVFAIHRERGERREESNLSIHMGELYQLQGKSFEAKELYEKALLISIEIGDRKGEATCYGHLGTLLQSLGEFVQAIQYLEKALAIVKQIGDKNGEAACYVNLGIVFDELGEYVKATKYLEKALTLKREIGDRNGEALCYANLGNVFGYLGKYAKAIEYLEKSLTIKREINDRNGEASCYGSLGNVLESVGEYVKATKYLEKSLAIKREIGDRNGEALCYLNLGNVYESQSDFVQAKEYFEKGLMIKREIGDRNGEASCYISLGSVLETLGEYGKAKEYVEKALTIKREIGDRNGEASCYISLGNVLRSVGEYFRAKEYFEKALTMTREIGVRHGESSCYQNLGTVLGSLGENVKAKEYLEKSLTIKREIGDKNGEATCYLNLGNVLHTLGEHVKAKEYLEKGLTISREIGDSNGEALCYVNLGNVFVSLGEYVKAKEFFEKALEINRKIGDRYGETSCYQNLGTLFDYLGEYVKAKDYLTKALKIKREIGDKNGEASCHVILGSLFVSLGTYPKAAEYFEEALRMKKDTGDRKGETECYRAFAGLFEAIGDYINCEKYLEKSIAINKEIGDKSGEAASNTSLGTLYRRLGDHGKAEEYIRIGLALFEESGDIGGQLTSLCDLAYVKFDQGKTQEAISFLLPAIQKAEHLRSFLGGNDELKILFTNEHVFPYWVLSYLFCVAGNSKEALFVSELGRARALADLMSAQYSVEVQISAEPQSWVSIERIVKVESSCTCLYISYFDQQVLLWILNSSGLMHFRTVSARNVQEELAMRNLGELFTNGSFRSFGILPGEHCEDRSLNEIQMKRQSCEEVSHGPLRKDDKESLGPQNDLSLCYKLIIAPVSDLLDEPEVIIVPDRSLCSVPFAALPDENGKCFAERFRIRSVPSLSTLKIIQDSPSDYHSQTGALLVGNPDVDQVRRKGRLKEISRLPCAESEAIMVGGMLDIKPLLGKEATKQAVLQVIHSVSLVHFAAHGDAERGEILLAPSSTSKGIPREEDYLLTMSDISKVQLRAKLVVLSCCHSAHGQVKAEGVVGIARAFLGSGARSVLVALWALDDSATEHFMRRFYEHLVRGESSSECLHQAMKWMRGNGYPGVRHWAPFVLIGDNVAFDFKDTCK